MSHIEEKALAQTLFAGLSAEEMVEDRCCSLWPDSLDHVGFDSYDESIEVHFIRRVPADMEATVEQCRVLESWGFRCGWFNFADGTEQYWAGTKQLKGREGLPQECTVWPRKKVDHSHWHSNDDMPGCVRRAKHVE